MFCTARNTSASVKCGSFSFASYLTGTFSPFSHIAIPSYVLFTVILSLSVEGGSSATICNELDSAERTMKKKMDERECVCVIVCAATTAAAGIGMEGREVRNVTREGRKGPLSAVSRPSATAFTGP